MRVETERMYLYPLSDEEMRLVIENESDQEMKALLKLDMA